MVAIALVESAGWRSRRSVLLWITSELFATYAGQHGAWPAAIIDAKYTVLVDASG
jgi:hypothetical protein